MLIWTWNISILETRLLTSYNSFKFNVEYKFLYGACLNLKHCTHKKYGTYFAKKNVLLTFLVLHQHWIGCFFLKRLSLPKCLQSCEIQENSQQVSFTSYPQKFNFVHRRSFCDTASHILQRTCNDPNRY